jgi:hypothetical protein
MTPAFVGFVVVPLVRAAAEMASEFSGARKDRPDLNRPGYDHDGGYVDVGEQPGKSAARLRRNARQLSLERITSGRP